MRVKNKSELCFFSCYIGFIWQDFGSRGTAGVTSLRKDQGLLPCWTRPVPAGSKTDPLLAKAEPIGEAGGASVITYLRKGKNAAQQL